MNQSELIALSKKVAEAYGIKAFEEDLSNLRKPRRYLHEDSAICFDLAVENDLRIRQLDLIAEAGYLSNYSDDDYHGFIGIQESYRNHKNDSKLSTRVAILKALLAIKG